MGYKIALSNKLKYAITIIKTSELIIEKPIKNNECPSKVKIL